jgi:hypothetical protein
MRTLRRKARKSGGERTKGEREKAKQEDVII